jgi:hypothetical protein
MTTSLTTTIMSSGHSPIERPLARKKKRQHDGDDDDDYNISRSNKKRRLSEYLERENHSKTKNPLRDVTFRANPLQERGNNNCPLRNHIIKTDPSNANEHDNSSASLPWSCRIRTESSQDANCANNSESLLPYHIIETSSSQDDEPYHTESESLSLPRNQMTQQVLEVGDTYNASSECVQKDDGLGGNHKGCTASGAIPKDDYVENKSSSDHMGGTNFQSAQDGECDNDNSEFLLENEEEVSTIQVLPRFRRIITIDSINKKLTEDAPCNSIFRSPSHTRHSQGVIAITQQNRHLSFPTTEKKSGISKAPRSLLQKVLSRPGASIPLDKFSFLEDEIEFVDIIGETTEEQHHARIFRITASGRSFALKVASIRNSIQVLSPLLTPLLRSTSTGRMISPSPIHNSLFPINASTANRLHMRAPHVFKIYLRLRSPNATDT